MNQYPLIFLGIACRHSVGGTGEGTLIHFEWGCLVAMGKIQAGFHSLTEPAPEPREVGKAFNTPETQLSTSNSLVIVFLEGYNMKNNTRFNTYKLYKTGKWTHLFFTHNQTIDSLETPFWEKTIMRNQKIEAERVGCARVRHKRRVRKSARTALYIYSCDCGQHQHPLLCQSYL